MRDGYRITRGRDGRLIVRRPDGPGKTGRRLGFLFVSVALASIFSYLISFSGALSKVAELPRTLVDSESAAPIQQIPEAKIVIDLALPGQGSSQNIAGPEAETTPTFTETASTSVATVSTEPDPIPSSEQVSVEALPAQSTDTPIEEFFAPVPELGIHRITVKSGDSLYTIFNGLGVHQRELIEITKGDGKQLKRIHPGQTLTFHIDSDNTLNRLVYELDEVHAIHFARDGSSFTAERVETPLEIRHTFAHGRIESSLFLAGQAAGLPDKTIMQIAEIFGWDVDFALDIRTDDQFNIIYEELYKNDKKVRNGDILAAEFVNQGRVIRALRYTDKSGDSQYYTPAGDSMRKAFLRTPVAFSRISSYFGKRKHPILSTVRNHNGVDYAARSGTPIKATGDGRIEFAGRKGGYGKTIIVRHGSTYTTLYAHMSKFAKGVKNGKAVRQGQIIGYVGSTGLATGPHLHYEFRVRGVHRNPLKVELPKAAPIASEYLSDFKNQTRDLALKLNRLGTTQIASSE